MKHFLIIFLLCLAPSISAENIVCEIDRPSIVDRVVNRSYPSVLSLSSHAIANEPIPENQWEWPYYKNVVARRDMFGQVTFRAQVYFQYLTPDGSHLVFRGKGDVEHTEIIVDQRHQLQSLNPDFLFIAGFYYYGAHPSDYYPEDWQYWLRDEQGNRIQAEGYGEMLIDYTLPGAEDHFVQMAVSVANCGIFDGIFLDLWSEDASDIPGTSNTAHLYHGDRIEALVSLVKRIREAVGDDFLILVNTRTQKIPRSAPYINGAYIETWDAVYSRERLIELEDALSWYNENLRHPQINGLEIAKSPNEPWDSPGNRQLARVTTTLSLTHTDGYIAITGKQQNPEARYWYRFWDAPLGSPVGAKSQRYGNIDGLFIREFTGGYVVYNRSGKKQQFLLPEPVSGWHSGVSETRAHTLGDLDGEIYLKPVATRADVNGDGVVNVLDLVIVANAFGKDAPDLNGDSVVNILDLVEISSAFGQRY